MHKSLIRWGRAGCAALLGIAGLAGQAHAVDPASFPDKPMRLIVTFPPGGGTDALARLIATELSQSVGQPVIVDNRPGASGNIGAEAVAKSPADGLTLLVVNSSYAINPAIFRKLPFDARNDLKGVILIASTPSVIAVPTSSKVRTLGELIESAKAAKPVSYASCGNGTPQHFAGELLRMSTNIHFVHVPYKGCAPALTDVLGGQVEVSINTLANTVPHLKSSKLRALAVTSKARVSLLPEVPSVQDLGVSGYDVDQWFGFLVPAKTPPAIVDKLNAEIGKIVARADIKQKLADRGFAAATSTPDEFQRIIRGDIDRFEQAARQIGLTAD
ncbi:MAG: tripartite tricarboxylate transporter substrate binding protein [Burkholderiaceae bacterium]